MDTFAERLKALRKERRMTSKEMAEYLDVSQRAYLYYESATHYPDVPGLIKLADYFEVTTDYLLGRSDQQSCRGGWHPPEASHRYGRGQI